MRKTQKGTPTLPNRDHLERAHFALQASVFLQELGASSSSPIPTSKGKERAGPAPSNADFARLAQNQMRAFRRWTVHNLVKL
jgi:hypothetical protein